MPRLIRIDEKKEKTTRHSECGAVIGYFMNEVSGVKTIQDYGRGSDQYGYIICPNCGKQIQICVS
jgi:hypothetical protein